MRRGQGKRRFGAALLAAMMLLGSAAADASPPPRASLEEQARTEFARTGIAVHQRLEKEAAGDLIGARVAAQEADAHRYRFLDLQRELAHENPPALTSLSVAAPRDPFRPDRAFLSPPSTAATQATSKRLDTTRDSPMVERAWDMYRHHESQPSDSSASRDPESLRPPGDMYGPTVTIARPAVTATASLEEAPRAPFLVYRAGTTVARKP